MDPIAIILALGLALMALFSTMQGAAAFAIPAVSATATSAAAAPVCAYPSALYLIAEVCPRASAPLVPSASTTSTTTPGNAIFDFIATKFDFNLYPADSIDGTYDNSADFPATRTGCGFMAFLRPSIDYYAQHVRTTATSTAAAAVTAVSSSYDFFGATSLATLDFTDFLNPTDFTIISSCGPLAPRTNYNYNYIPCASRASPMGIDFAKNQTLPVALKVAATAATPRVATPAPVCITMGGGKLCSPALHVATTLTAGHAAAALSDLYSALKEPTLRLTKTLTPLLDYSYLRALSSIIVIPSTLLPTDFVALTTTGLVAVARLDYLITIVALTIVFGFVTSLALRHARPTSKIDSGVHDDLDACDSDLLDGHAACDACDSTVADSDAETLVDACPNHSTNLKSDLETNRTDDDDMTVSGSTTATTSDSTCTISPASVLELSVLDIDTIKSVTVPESEILGQFPTTKDTPARDTVSRPTTPTELAPDAGLAQSIGSVTPTILSKNININNTKPVAAALDAEVALATGITIPASDLASRPTTPTVGLDIEASMTMSKTLPDGYESGYETDASCSDSDSSDEDPFGFEIRGAASIDRLSCSALLFNGTFMPPSVSADVFAPVLALVEPLAPAHEVAPAPPSRAINKSKKKSTAAKKPAAAATAYASPSSSDSELAAEYVSVNAADVVDEIHEHRPTREN
ncbi:hypothetical protein H9P43_007453 [Blastocladiella emersonii ATCC 22665]|nr:hypothetical protein H9P43_007446 [Blastocladiella emersonii ATCC 22665]KAI9173322.1 hypothetical protein H9P43_007453 [Blastocladiella emersonii ATCC 22665]